jgi:hypothetical protein
MEGRMEAAFILSWSQDLSMCVGQKNPLVFDKTQRVWKLPSSFFNWPLVLHN